MLDKKYYQHPKDRSLLNKVLEMDVVEKLFNWCRKNQVDSVLVYAYRSSCLEITEKSIPDVYRMVSEACALFGVEEMPICFLVHDFTEKIQLTGIFTPILLISDTYLENAEERALYGTIAGQIASIALGHQSGIGLIWLVDNCSSQLPIPATLVKSVNVVLNKWKRCRWFSCDRAALLAVEDYEIAQRVLFDWTLAEPYLSAFEFSGERSLYEEQAAMFMEASATENLAKMLNSMMDDTAWLPERYLELKKFFVSERKGEGIEDA